LFLLLCMLLQFLGAWCFITITFLALDNSSYVGCRSLQNWIMIMKIHDAT
jgi:hypothetical protein